VQSVQSVGLLFKETFLELFNIKGQSIYRDFLMRGYSEA